MPHSVAGYRRSFARPAEAPDVRSMFWLRGAIAVALMTASTLVASPLPLDHAQLVSSSTWTLMNVRNPCAVTNVYVCSLTGDSDATGTIESRPWVKGSDPQGKLVTPAGLSAGQKSSGQVLDFYSVNDRASATKNPMSEAFSKPAGISDADWKKVAYISYKYGAYQVGDDIAHPTYRTTLAGVTGTNRDDFMAAAQAAVWHYTSSFNLDQTKSAERETAAEEAAENGCEDHGRAEANTQDVINFYNAILADAQSATIPDQFVLDAASPATAHLSIDPCSTLTWHAVNVDGTPQSGDIAQFSLDDHGTGAHFGDDKGLVTTDASGMGSTRVCFTSPGTVKVTAQPTKDNPVNRFTAQGGSHRSFIGASPTPPPNALPAALTTTITVVGSRVNLTATASTTTVSLSSKATPITFDLVATPTGDTPPGTITIVSDMSECTGNADTLPLCDLKNLHVISSPATPAVTCANSNGSGCTVTLVYTPTAKAKPGEPIELKFSMELPTIDELSAQSLVPPLQLTLHSIATATASAAEVGGDTASIDVKVVDGCPSYTVTGSTVPSTIKPNTDVTYTIAVRGGPGSMHPTFFAPQGATIVDASIAGGGPGSASAPNISATADSVEFPPRNGADGAVLTIKVHMANDLTAGATAKVTVHGPGNCPDVTEVVSGIVFYK